MLYEIEKSYSLKKYFHRFEPKTRLKVKTISIDMYLPYIQLIKEMFPNAKIIIDPFHIVQALNRELNRTRVRVMNSIAIKTLNYIESKTLLEVNFKES